MPIARVRQGPFCRLGHDHRGGVGSNAEATFDSHAHADKKCHPSDTSNQACERHPEKQKEG